MRGYGVRAEYVIVGSRVENARRRRCSAAYMARARLILPSRLPCRRAPDMRMGSRERLGEHKPRYVNRWREPEIARRRQRPPNFATDVRNATCRSLMSLVQPQKKVNRYAFYVVDRGG